MKELKYTKTFINKGEGVALIKNMLLLNNKLESLNRTRYRYLIGANEKTLFKVVSTYIPDSISYFSKSEIDLMTRYLDGVETKYTKYKA